ncbi:MAG TPA: hypothetical protein VJA47_05560 [archaeon]|nr:hypothetical protein [archaeon]
MEGEIDPLRNRMEAVRELKAEYGIGSQDALRYLKIRERYQILKDKVAQVLESEGSPCRLTVRETENIDDCFAWGSLYNAISGLLYKGPQGPERVFLVKGYGQIKVDIEEFLIEYCRQRNQTDDPDIAFRDAYRVIFEGGKPFLEILGRKVSFQDIKDGNVETEPLPDDLFIDEDEASQFRLWLIGAENENPFSYISPEESPTRSEHRYLLNNAQLGRRIERDQTSGSLWEERRLALNAMSTYSMLERLDYDLMGKKCRNAYGVSIDARLSALESDLRAIRDPEQRRIIRKEILAIKKNRAWLERFLSG